ncbi:MAG: hypothetical protein HY660_04490 [Armatimonadetes bacterium]|nr:hypothetical protein [Armatimonadota bacterium]
MMHAWGWRTMLAILLSLLLAIGTATAAPITTLIVVTSGGVGQAPMYVGVARGIFEKHGLKIQMISAKIGALKQAPTFEEMFDVRILRQVEREHPEFFRDLPPIPNALKL